MASAETTNANHLPDRDQAADGRRNALRCIGRGSQWGLGDIHHTARCAGCGGGLARLDSRTAPTATRFLDEELHVPAVCSVTQEAHLAWHQLTSFHCRSGAYLTTAVVRAQHNGLSRYEW